MDLPSTFENKTPRSSARTGRRGHSASPERSPRYKVHGKGTFFKEDLKASGDGTRSSSKPKLRLPWSRRHSMPIEIVFSFDTTGSMAEAFEDVKVKIKGIAKKLKADIPGIKIGIIAHGDYWDKDDPYVIRKMGLTDDVAKLNKFVSETEETNGWDYPECYELALRRAKEMSWTPGSKRILVVIGDAIPHDPDFELNEDKIDWRQEAQELRDKSVTIYAVQFGDNDDSTDFFEELTRVSGGQRLNLTNPNVVGYTIMAICYRECSLEMLLAFERELIRAGGIPDDLKKLFDDLRSKTTTSRPMTDKEKEKSFVLDCVATNSVSRGSAIPEYDAQNDPALSKYFRSRSVRKILRKTAQPGGSRSRPGTSRDPSPERLLSLRNQSGAGHSDDTVAGHDLFMDGSMSARDFCGYNGEGGYRRNTPWLRANPSSFTSAPPVGHHQDVPKH